MSIIALILIVALLIPIMESWWTLRSGVPSRAGWKGPGGAAGLAELAKKSSCSRPTWTISPQRPDLQDENAFLQRLLADSSPRSTLPTPPGS